MRPHETSCTMNEPKDEAVNNEVELKVTKSELFPLESVQLGWSNNCNWNVGAGMINMGNTCYMNSTLQALFHVPAFVKWLVSRDEFVHALTCVESGKKMCVICATRMTLLKSQTAGSSFRPIRIFKILTSLNREFRAGEPQDAHEFLRCLVEKMDSAYLSRFRDQLTQIDEKLIQTTPLHQIFGGDLSSCVKCSGCSRSSTTKQHFLDVPLDIEKAGTLQEAIAEFFSVESLDCYRCEYCRAEVPATKQFALERSPKVLCLQLKRFSYFSNGKITKDVEFSRRLDLTEYRKNASEPLMYNLVSFILHHGSLNSDGHYTCAAQAPSGSFYMFNDHSVLEMPPKYVTGSFTTADTYIMLYEHDPNP